MAHYIAHTSGAAEIGELVGAAAPYIMALAAVSFRLLAGRWPHVGALAIGGAVPFVLGAVSLIASILAGASAVTVETSFAFCSGTVRYGGTTLYFLALLVGMAIGWLRIQLARTAGARVRGGRS